MEVPGYLRENYEELCRTTDYPRCHRIIPQIDPFTVHSWMNALLYERLERPQRVSEAIRRLKERGVDEQVIRECLKDL